MEESDEACCFDQIVEKNLSCSAKVIECCPTMDLIAVAFVSNEVHLYRLAMQAVWKIDVESEVFGLKWRPDGWIFSDVGCWASHLP